MIDETAELEYRYIERLAILCGDAEPTLDQRRMARQDVERWLQDQAAPIDKSAELI